MGEPRLGLEEMLTSQTRSHCARRRGCGPVIAVLVLVGLRVWCGQRSAPPECLSVGGCVKCCWDMEDGEISLLASQGGLHSGACFSIATRMMRERFQRDRQKAQLLQKAGAGGRVGTT